MTRSLVVAALAIVALVVTGCRSHHAAAATGARWCRAGEPPIRVSRRTSCELAGRILNAVYGGRSLPRGRRRTIFVSSPVTRRRYRIQVVRRGNLVTGTGCCGIWARFPYQL